MPQTEGINVEKIKAEVLAVRLQYDGGSYPGSHPMIADLCDRITDELLPALATSKAEGFRAANEIQRLTHSLMRAVEPFTEMASTGGVWPAKVLAEMAEISNRHKKGIPANEMLPEDRTVVSAWNELTDSAMDAYYIAEDGTWVDPYDRGGDISITHWKPQPHTTGG